MKKLIFAVLILFAFGCRENNRASEREEDLDDYEIVKPDTTASDTATIWDRQRDVNSDRMDRDESGIESGEQSDTASTWDRDRNNLNDTIQ